MIRIARGATRALFEALLLLAANLATTARAETGAGAPDAALAAQGKRLYATGVGTAGKPVAAIDISGQKVFAPQFHCISCHRASGFGSKEGGVFIPPIAATVLYQPLRPDRARSFNSMYFQPQTAESASRVYQARTRPAYDRASLARLLRTGIDPAGKPVPTAMPRYRVSDRDVAALDAWLRGLSAHPDPGVDAETIRFAVIVSDNVSPLTRRALLDTTRAYAERMNRNTGADRARPNFSPYFRSEFASFWRNWAVDVWELHGPRESWPKQLADRYAAAPVFAVIGAATEGPWQPIADFCDSKRLPCLFPLTDLPLADPRPDSYTIYTYGGLPLEGRALAAWLARDKQPARVFALESNDLQGQAAADAFAAAGAGLHPQRVPVAPGGWGKALAALPPLGGDDVVVIWPGGDAASAVAQLQATGSAAGRIVFGAAAGDLAVAAFANSALAPKIRIVRPTELPSVINPHSYRVRAWLNARRVVVDPPEEQFQVYYALSVLEKAVMEIQGDFSRDYLIEQIEMIAESNLSPGVYPTLSLGPGQRVASRGSYVVKLDGSAPGGIVADGDWIVP